MASIAKDQLGNRRIQFTDTTGERVTMYLGKTPQRAAETIKLRVEQLLVAKRTGHPLEADTIAWLAKLDTVMTEKLIKAGLMQSIKKRDVIPLGKFMDDYIATRTDVKPLTLRHLKDSRRCLTEYFGEHKPLDEITPGDADEYRRWLLKSLGENTVRRRCGRAKQFFRAALRKRLITTDPFSDMKGCGVRPNKAREFFVDRATCKAVLDACPDAEWRLIFALSRFGGFRTPSEHMALRWSDVNWERNRFTVRSSKTERHEGGGIRIVPIFPELKPYLEEVWNALGDKRSEFVITLHRGINANLRTQFKRILTRAGVKPWPKLFQNLRASRATELVAEFPPHVAAEWLGHSTLVAQKHYWQVTDMDFTRASGVENTTPGSPSETPSAESDAIVADVKNEAPITAMATNPEVAEIAATWANLSPAARQCMMLLIRNS